MAPMSAESEEDLEKALNELPQKVIEDAHVLIYRNLSQHNLTTYYKDRKWNGLGRGYSNGAYPFDHAAWAPRVRTRHWVVPNGDRASQVANAGGLGG